MGKSLSIKDIKRGFVAGPAAKNTPHGVETFEAQVIIINHPGQICPGYTPVLDCHTAHIACRFDALLEKMGKRSGKSMGKNPKFVKNGEACKAILKPTKPMCVEAYKEYPPLGRFAVRDMRQTVAVGLIQST